MGKYLDDNAPMGPNIKKLLAQKVATDGIPKGGGLASGIALLLEPKRLLEVSRNALIWVEQALEAVKAAPDNPYGDDDEAIAAAILASMEEKKQ